MSIATPVLLVVEDELPLLEAIIAEAGKAGFEVVSARAVEEAERFLRQIPTIDAVWVDHFLPGQEGLELVKFARRDKRLKNVPFFLVSNVIEPEIVNLYLQAGVQGYYPKMLSDLSDILVKIKRELSGRMAATPAFA